MSSPYNRRRNWESAPKKGAPVRGAGPSAPMPPEKAVGFPKGAASKHGGVRSLGYRKHKTSMDEKGL